jgi:glyoxylase-like metal-dependent hydrolase (beta-lactamase superfamily II)
MNLYSIHTGNFKLDGGAMFGVVPKSIWNKVYPADENNLITLAMRCLLVVDGDRKILIDNGIGNKQDDKFFGHYFLHGIDSLEKSLNAVGLTPFDITDMFLTHLHFDHCGGSVKQKPSGEGYELTFPNATYWINESQWDWAIDANRREKASFLSENILPIAESGKLKLFKGPLELIPGFNVRIFNGHSVGQSIPFISYKGKTVVFMADTTPTSAHVPLPYIMSYDTQPLISLQEKEDFMNEAVDNDFVLFFEHDAYTECCNLERTEKGIKVKNTFSLNEIFSESIKTYK